MQDQNPIDPGDRELEEALGALRPAASSTSREELLFRAGRRSLRGSVWAWRCASVVAAALALGMFLRPVPQQVPTVVYVEKPPKVVYETVVREVPVSAAVAVSSDASSSRVDAREFRLRQRIIRFGPDAMPAQASAAPANASLDRNLGLSSSELGIGGLLLRSSTQHRGGL